MTAHDGVCLALAEALVNEPIVGTDDRLLAGLRAARAGAPVDETPDERRGPVPLSALSARALWDSPGGLEDLPVHPAPPAETGALLRRLGTPPGCQAADVAALEGLVADAARTAWQLAVDDGGTDPLLAELRARGSAATRELGPVRRSCG